MLVFTGGSCPNDCLGSYIGIIDHLKCEDAVHSHKLTGLVWELGPAGFTLEY